MNPHFHAGLDFQDRRAPNGVPPFDGVWIRREDCTAGLDSAGHLNNIAYYSHREWHRGITSESVQYWVRIDDRRDKQEQPQ